MSAVIEEAVRKSDEVEGKVQDLFGKVNDALDWIPWPFDYLVQPITAGMEKLQAEVQKFWQELAEYLDNVGNPGKLQAHAEQWRDQVGNPIGAIADGIALEKLATNTEWTGSGAEAYKAIVPPQGDGLNKMKSLSIELSKTLQDLANGIEDFWIAIGIALGSLVVGIVAAIVEACTVVAIPAAILTAIAAIGVAITFIGAAVVALKGIYDKIDTSQTTIKQGITDLGTEWARAEPRNQKKIDTPGQWETI
ncbi:hypothetical protein [Amycolatopsis aidingensis]|uniref:hypothetical protein n=1 Tax=Amycolatopsis aidingensis TaxID=2842453 RepID=UPI001C0DF0B2|nr:hypothetical protein [Amycolatopsis aidingensis]